MFSLENPVGRGFPDATLTMYTVGEGLDPPYRYATMLLREGQDPPLQEIYQICQSEEARMADVGISSTAVTIITGPLDIEHPGFSMLSNIFTNRTAQQEIATGPKALAMTNL